MENLEANSEAERLKRLAAIQEGLDDIKAGRTIPHDVVMKEMEDIIEGRTAKTPGAGGPPGPRLERL